MKVLVLGSGNIGSAAAEDLAKSMSSAEIVIADKDRTRARTVAESIGGSNVSWMQVDASSPKKLLHVLKDFELIMGFLPGRLGYGLMETCIEAKKDLVDVSYMAENPLQLQRVAAKAGITIVPDCGLAPGISNFLVGHTVRELDRIKAVHIMVGGLPDKPIPPLGYAITWSSESLIDEYTRKAMMIRHGKKTVVEALSGLETIDFPGVGKLEAFYTDGLRTLAYTIDGEDMWEKTLRYPGHAEKVRLLKALGFFKEDEIDVNAVKVSPRRLTLKLFDQKLKKPEIRDFVALRVEVCGLQKGKKMCYTYHLLDRYDKQRQITAMARTTAYPMSIVAQVILSKAAREKGVVPPEKLGMDDKVFKLFQDGLEKRGIRISEEKTAR